ncbi:DUF1440 domain-containing protein [uncultured Shewanella sp.]|uniref:YagU family protein n=1 Tax=uncultured Shewanella sp. TaxID=173975 RepID=UPI002637890E|nr:DUF1440 domain-containing protein [uncultured Shewanella sp.]
MSLITKTPNEQRRFGLALWAGFLGGNLASFVKWGTENPFPPRTPDRGIPPFDMLQDFGLQVSQMIYQFSEHMINWGVAGVHHGFSIVFAMLYCVMVEVFPQVKLWQGIAFSIVITLLFHGLVLPLGGWAPHMWQLPTQEIISEFLGHGLWMWAIELVRIAIREKKTAPKSLTRSQT